MGMFDEVVCKYPLPDARYQNKVFQTKDLECNLDDYTITADGRLVVAVKEPVIDETVFFGFRIVDTGAVHDLEFHGDLYFYHYDTSRDLFVEYIARFTQGTVEYIRHHADRAGAEAT